MLITKYLTKRLLGYFCVLSMLLTILLNGIEFFEKLVRIKHATVIQILHFLVLNTLPTFFSIAPLAATLATSLMLYDLVAYHEWELLQLLTVAGRRLCLIIAMISFCITSCTFFCQVWWGTSLALKAEQFKQEHFKMVTNPHILAKRWLSVNPYQMVYVEQLDSRTFEGKDVLLISLAQDFSIAGITKSPGCFVDVDDNKILLPSGQRFQVDGRLSVALRGISEACQARERVGQFIYYLQLFVSPLLTLLLFMVFYHAGFWRWLLALLSYPLFMFLRIVFTHT